jgi:thioredoxin-like negative regulator of GroEL
MVMVPVLLLLVVLADTEYATVPFPVPALPAVIVIHEGSLLAAFQGQLLEVVTATVPVLPKELKRELVGEMV